MQNIHVSGDTKVIIITYTVHVCSENSSLISIDHCNNDILISFSTR